MFPTVRRYILVSNRRWVNDCCLRPSGQFLRQEQATFCWGHGVSFIPDLHVQLKFCSAYRFSGIHYTDSLIISLYFYSFRCMFSGEAADTKLFCSKRSGIENMSYCTRIKQANHYTTVGINVCVSYIQIVSLHKLILIDWYLLFVLWDTFSSIVIFNTELFRYRCFFKYI
jgi:hypothetical protein